MSWREPRHTCLEWEEMTGIGLENCVFLVIRPLLQRLGPWKETVDPKSYLLGTPAAHRCRQGQKQRCCMWVGVTVCLTANIPL